jgi:hypothetical protein
MNVKPKKDLKERTSAAAGSSARRSNKHGIASVNDIFGAGTRTRPQSTTSSPSSPDESERIDKIPEKITSKMKSRAVAELPTVSRRLVDMALERRSLDNVSVMVVWF